MREVVSMKIPINSDLLSTKVGPPAGTERDIARPQDDATIGSRS